MKKLIETRNYLQAWQERLKKANEVVPAVQEAIEEFDWQIETLNQRPPESHAIATSQIDEQADIAYERITGILPQMPQYDPSIGIQINSIAAAGGTVSFLYIQQVNDMGTPGALDYAKNAFTSYRVLQVSHSRPDRVRNLIVKKFPTVVSKFDSAKTTYLRCSAGIVPEHNSALEMRTVLDAIKGELFERARSLPKEKMTWEKMSERLVSDLNRRATLLKQKDIRRTLYDDLSNVLKQREVRSIDILWMQTLDHLLVVLTEIC